ncbi:MAG: arginine--tRNA ligase [Alphaproteobacteria bacterium]|nr:arginine--tRNA ligase [Alphaproteobacteria bacterium]
MFDIFISCLAKKIAENNDIFQADAHFKPLVEFPKLATHGDFTCNAAMVLAKKAGRNPRELAQILADTLQTHDDVVDVTIAGAGFINWRVRPEFFHRLMRDIYQHKESFGIMPQNKQKVNVEYVSANPTGPLHVGHVRGAVFGDVLANILQACGYDVTREYYINDAGNQVTLLTYSLYWRYQQILKAVSGDMPSDYYPGDYLVKLAEDIVARDGKKWLDCGEAIYFPIFRTEALDAMMLMIKQDLQSLNIEMDFYNSEQRLLDANKTEEVLSLLNDKKLLYKGVLPPPKGKLPDDWEEREQLLFRSTEFGDDIDRPLQKSNGDYTYFSNDIAGHYDKYQRGFTRMINIFGADHGGYVKRLKAAVRAISDNKAVLDILLMQIVRLTDDGVPIKMSKRSGNFVTLRELVDEVKADAVRFIMLTRDNNAQMDFDFAVAKKESSENPAFYVKYAYARLCSVKKLVHDAFPDENFTDEGFMAGNSQEIMDYLSLLRDDKELMIMKKCSDFPNMLQQAAQKAQPHLLCYYLLELSELCHRLWSAGNRDVTMRFIVKDDINLTKARLILADILLIILKNGLGLMKIEPPEKL